jgi:outer membrane protein assembly factor BamE (lipoprotein component of BamABCDE complex)
MMLDWLFGPDPKTYDVDKIERGFTKQQVREQFGEPTGVRKHGFSPEEWTYSIPWKVYVSISFDSDGRVTDTYSHTQR